MNNNYTVIYREDKLDDFLRKATAYDKKRLIEAYVDAMNGELARAKARIDKILLDKKVARYTPARTKIYESHVCGFTRVLETLELYA